MCCWWCCIFKSKFFQSGVVIFVAVLLRGLGYLFRIRCRKTGRNEHIKKRTIAIEVGMHAGLATNLATTTAQFASHRVSNHLCSFLYGILSQEHYLQECLQCMIKKKEKAAGKVNMLPGNSRKDSETRQLFV